MITDTKLGACVPAETHNDQVTVGANKYVFTCKYPATATTYTGTLTACSASSPCKDTTTQCCATRTVSYLNTAGTPTTQSCIDKTKAGKQIWASYTGANNLNGEIFVDAQCPAAPVNGGSTGTGSFGAYIKTSAMMLVALVAAMFF